MSAYMRAYRARYRQVVERLDVLESEQEVERVRSPLPTPAKHLRWRRCPYCGARTQRVVCRAHSDLPALDPDFRLPSPPRSR
jgi:hypothetical protein